MADLEGYTDLYATSQSDQRYAHSRSKSASISKTQYSPMVNTHRKNNSVSIPLADLGVVIDIRDFNDQPENINHNSNQLNLTSMSSISIQPIELSHDISNFRRKKRINKICLSIICILLIVLVIVLALAGANKI
jgi:hypothetical protein